MDSSPTYKAPVPVPGQPFIAIAWSLEKGRHVVVTQPVRAGQHVLQQAAYCSVLSDEEVEHRCDYCFQRGDDLLRCGRSKLARYGCGCAHAGGSAWQCGRMAAPLARWGRAHAGTQYPLLNIAVATCTQHGLGFT